MRFNKVILFIALLLIINISIPGSSFACQPCRTKLNFKDTVHRADLIIIGKKIADQGNMVNVGRDKFHPEGSRIKIFSVLKGKTGKDTINVRCLYGMCGYGICIHDDKLYVIFLSTTKSNSSGYDGAAVNSGCAVKYYKIIDNNVLMDGMSVPISRFENMISGK